MLSTCMIIISALYKLLPSERNTMQVGLMLLWVLQHFSYKVFNPTCHINVRSLTIDPNSQTAEISNKIAQH